MWRSLVFTALLLIGTNSALACLNDSDLVKSESEFKSAYLQKPVVARPESASLAIGWVAAVAGVAFFVCAVAVLRQAPKPTHQAE